MNIPYVLKDMRGTRRGSRPPAARGGTGIASRRRRRISIGPPGRKAVLPGNRTVRSAFSTESDNHMRGPVRNLRSVTHRGRQHGRRRGGGRGRNGCFRMGAPISRSIRRSRRRGCGVVGCASPPRPGRWISPFSAAAAVLLGRCEWGRSRATWKAARCRGSARTSVNLECRAAVLLGRSRGRVDARSRARGRLAVVHGRHGRAPSMKRVSGWSLESACPRLRREWHLHGISRRALGRVHARGELPVAYASPRGVLGCSSGGRFDRRIHPEYGDPPGGDGADAALSQEGPRRRAPSGMRRRFEQVWDTGAFVVLSPTLRSKPPRHGWGALAVCSMSFCKLGNLIDATGLAIPFRDVPGDASALPRSAPDHRSAGIRRRGPRAWRAARGDDRESTTEDRF